MSRAEGSGPGAGDILDGKLELLRPLGAGGMGTVFEAKNRRTGRHVAVKLLKGHLAEQLDSVQRFLQEALAGGRVQHPNVVDVYDAGVHDGHPYIVMELMRGESLGARLSRAGALPVQEAVQIALDAAAGIVAAHAAGIVHRDLKPENVFLCETQAGTTAKVLDFGISKLAEPDDALATTRTGAVVGTPHYMSFEQARGVKDVDARADVYGLGAVLYHALTGRPPFEGDNYNALIAAILTEPIVPVAKRRSDVPEPIARVVERALAKSRDERFATVAELARELGQAAGQEVSAPTPRVSSGGPRRDSRASDVAETPAARVAATPRVVAASPARSSSWLVRGAVALVAVGAVLTALAIVASSSAPTAPGRSSRAGAPGAQAAQVPPLPEIPIDPRRVAVVATIERGGGGLVEPAFAWSLTSRIVEEIDRYTDFHPASPGGVLAAREAELGMGERLPDEIEALRIARRVRAGTLAALVVRPVPTGFAIAVHVASIDDAGGGASARPVSITRESLDSTGPSEVAAALLAALTRLFGLAELHDVGGMTSQTTPFQGYQLYFEGMQRSITGDYAAAERQLRQAIATDATRPSYWSMLACALSFQEKDPTEAVARARALLSNASSRLDRTIVQQDLAWVEAELAKRRGDRPAMIRKAREILALDHVLADEYGYPVGFLYAASVHQYFLQDIPMARRLYAQARAQSPTLYPAYYEEAKILRTDPRMRGEAARLLWTFARCFPESPLAHNAARDAAAWHLAEPAEPARCTRPVAR